MYIVNIGDISNSKIKSETSKVQLGEIGKNVSIIDLESKYYNYNFSEDFKTFNLKGDYTELNLYKVKESNYGMNVIGKKTTLNLNGEKTIFDSAKNSEFIKILEKKSKTDAPNGVIDIQLKNGILNIKD